MHPEYWSHDCEERYCYDGIYGRENGPTERTKQRRPSRFSAHRTFALHDCISACAPDISRLLLSNNIVCTAFTSPSPWLGHVGRKGIDHWLFSTTKPSLDDTIHQHQIMSAQLESDSALFPFGAGKEYNFGCFCVSSPYWVSSTSCLFVLSTSR